MVLDSKIAAVKNYFGVTDIESWRDVEPRWILELDGIGPVTLDHIRMYLAARDVTLKGDRTPDYWKQHLSEARICHTMGNEELGEAKDVAVINPFTVLIDSAEQQPFTFQGIHADADQGNRPLIVPTEWRCLGRHPESRGDYSILGYEGRIHIERKGKEDAHGTILGWGGRRERFEQELACLSEVFRAYVMVECSFGELMRTAPEWGKKTAAENSKIIGRTVISWMHKFSKVQWLFLDDRRLAEIVCFRTLEKFWKEETL